MVCIVYAVDDEDTLDSVTDHWLPFVRRTLGCAAEDAHSTPVILVGNKVDLVDYSTMESVLPIMNEFEEIETCVECSARNLKNISEMFYFAQKAILHPSAPLWSYHQKDVSTTRPGFFFEHFEKNSEEKNSFFSKNSAIFHKKLPQILSKTQCIGTVY